MTETLKTRLPRKRWHALVLVAGMAASAAAFGNPFAPPDDANADIADDVKDAEPGTFYSQEELERIYAKEIVTSIIRRSRVVSYHDGKTRLLYEPTMNCYLKQTGGTSLDTNPCFMRIQERWHIRQDGTVEYPVLEAIPEPALASQTASSADTGGANRPREVIANPATKQFADSSCASAYQDMQGERDNGASMITFNNATEALREGYRRVPSNEC